MENTQKKKKNVYGRLEIRSPRSWCDPEVRRRRSCRRKLLADSFCRFAVLIWWNMTELVRILRRASAFERSSAGIAGGWTSVTWWTPLWVGVVRGFRLFEVMRCDDANDVQRKWKLYGSQAVAALYAARENKASSPARAGPAVSHTGYRGNVRFAARDVAFVAVHRFGHYHTSWLRATRPVRNRRPDKRRPAATVCCSGLPSPRLAGRRTTEIPRRSRRRSHRDAARPSGRRTRRERPLRTTTVMSCAPCVHVQLAVETLINRVAPSPRNRTKSPVDSGDLESGTSNGRLFFFFVRPRTEKRAKTTPTGDRYRVKS